MVPCLRISLLYYRMLRAYQGLLRQPYAYGGQCGMCRDFSCASA